MLLTQKFIHYLKQRTSQTVSSDRGDSRRLLLTKGQTTNIDIRPSLDVLSQAEMPISKEVSTPRTVVVPVREAVSILSGANPFIKIK